MSYVWCIRCGDDFFPTEVSDLDTPLCSDECSDEYFSAEQNSIDYTLGG